MKLLIIICLLAFSASKVFGADMESPKVILQVIKDVDDIRTLLYPAQIDSKIHSTVTAEFEGRVKRILKPLGAHVKKGETVMVIENQDPAFTYAPVSLKAPVSGVLSQIGVPLMAKALKGDKLFTVVGLDTLRVHIEVPASEIAHLLPLTEGIFKSTGEDGAQFPVQVAGVSPVVDPRSGTASAELEFLRKLEKSPSALPPIGTVGQVSFKSVLGKVMLIPEAALKYLEGAPSVWLVDNENKAHRRRLVLGSQRGEVYIVKSGLQPGDRYVLRSDKRVKENALVQIEEGKKDAAL
jgi:multidrug efflux pump subunit AcrA (membrane-fusion protein)